MLKISMNESSTCQKICNILAWNSDIENFPSSLNRSSTLTAKSLILMFVLSNVSYTINFRHFGEKTSFDSWTIHNQESMESSSFQTFWCIDFLTLASKFSRVSLMRCSFASFSMNFIILYLKTFEMTMECCSKGRKLCTDWLWWSRSCIWRLSKWKLRKLLTIPCFSLLPSFLTDIFIFPLDNLSDSVYFIPFPRLVLRLSTWWTFTISNLRGAVDSERRFS